MQSCSEAGHASGMARSGAAVSGVVGSSFVAVEPTFGIGWSTICVGLSANQLIRCSVIGSRLLVDYFDNVVCVGKLGADHCHMICPRESALRAHVHSVGKQWHCIVLLTTYLSVCTQCWEAVALYCTAEDGSTVWKYRTRFTM